MADKDTILSDVMRERQLALRREIDRRSISLKALAFDSEIPVSTIRSYFPGERDAVPHVMPASALFALAASQALPLELLSLLLPDGLQLVAAPEDLDHDALAEHLHDYLAEKSAAHCPNSPGGRELSDCETEKLGRRAATIASIAKGR